MEIDDLIEMYENDKREKTALSKYAYDLNQHCFLPVRKAAKACRFDIDICDSEEIENRLFENGYALFVNPYKVCNKIISEYLKTECTEDDRVYFRKLKKEKDNIVIPFLWYFDHKDGLESFEEFENKKLTEILSDWCKKYGLKLEL